jgi:hypothetical protein
MLRAKGEITFTLDGKNYTADQLRPAFMFTEDLLFTGGIESDTDMYYQGKTYVVSIEFFTVEDEAYSALKPILKDNMDLAICSGKRVLGRARLRDFEYISA